jgi:16S rRNA processing protein RimM
VTTFLRRSRHPGACGAAHSAVGAALAVHRLQPLRPLSLAFDVAPAVPAVPAPPAHSSADASWPQDAVEVGRVLDAWGVKGWIKVQAFSADPQALFLTKRWYLQPPEQPRAPGAAPLPTLLKVTQAREHGDAIVAAVQEVTDRNGAEALRGARVFVSRSSFPTAQADEYYWVDLIGLDVVNREGLQLGRVADLLDTGAHSVLRIEADGGVERMVPFVAAYVDQVDLPGRRITVDWSTDWD